MSSDEAVAGVDPTGSAAWAGVAAPASAARTLGRTAALAAGYALLGGAGLFLAVPPGYATPVYPAAGLALAAALWFGPAALPGIWLGSAALNVAYAAVTGRFSSLTWVAAPLLGCGPALQAAAGAWLVRRRVGGWRRLEREQEVVGFYLWGGVLAGLVSASFSMPVLRAFGLASTAQLPANWWSWYVGDLLGVLVFAPLGLAFLDRRDPLWRGRRRRTAAPMLAALVLVVAAYSFAGRWEAQRNDEQLRRDGEAVADGIRHRIAAHRTVLASLRNFAQVTPGLAYDPFERFARYTLRDNPDVFALSINDLVAAEARASYEARMSALSPLGSYRITERAPDGLLVPAAPRPEHVAVRFIAPPEGNRPAVGFDILSEPVRREAIEQALHTKDLAVTAPIRLVQERQQRVGVLELLPFSMVEADGQRQEAFAVAVVKLDEMIGIATRGARFAGLELTDPSAPPEQRVLHRQPGETPGDGPSPAPFTTALRVGQRDWLLTVSGGPRPAPWLAWALGLAGLVILGLLNTLTLGITGRAAALQRQSDALLASEEQYRGLIQNLHAGVVVHGADARVAIGNATAAGLLGVTVDQLRGRDASDPAWRLVRADGSAIPPAEHPASRVVATRRAVANEVMGIARPGAETAWVLVNAHPVFRTGDQLTEVVVTFVDISERISLQEQLAVAARFAAMGTLVAGVAHEINNPLAAVLAGLGSAAEAVSAARDRLGAGAVQDPLALRAELDEVLGALDDATSGGQRIARIVKDLGLLGRPDPGRTQVQLADVVDDAMRWLRATVAPAAAIRLERRSAPAVLAAPGQVAQVLVNLVTNAVRAIPAGMAGHIVVRVGPGDGGRARLEVEDDGVGMRPEVMERIFDPYFTTRAGGEGSGLGLPVCRAIVEAHGGTITVRSAPGQGATFRVELPAAPGPGEPPGAGAAG